MMSWLEQNPAKATRLSLALALLSAALFYGIGSFYGPGGHPAPIFADAYIFHQYARQLAEGHPYQFNTGDPATTGCTSHLYPALLAAAYKCGARGWAILTAAAAVNAAMLAASVPLFAGVMRRLDERSAGLAVLLYSLCGVVHVAAFSQMDSMLFLLVSLAMLSALLHERAVPLALLAFVAPWCRPEGVILSGFLLLAAAAPFPGAVMRRAMVAAGLAGAASHGLVMALNHALTGMTTFHSLVGKSPFFYTPAYNVLGETIQEAGRLVRELGLGIAETHRQFFLPPVAGALLVCLGVMNRDWRRPLVARAEACWLGASAAALLLIAYSRWAGVQYDRYVTWMTPMLSAYLAMGVMAACRGGSRGRLGAWIIAGTLLWQVAGLLHLMMRYQGNCAGGAANAAFLESVGRRLPSGTRIGMTSGAGVKYIFPHLHVTNVNGIETAAFARRDHAVTNIELLKHDPSLRFDHWLVPAATTTDDWFGGTLGPQVMAEVPALGSRNTTALYEADWSRLDAAAGPRTLAVRRAISDMTLTDSLDIGWIPDEEAHDHEVFSRIRGSMIRPHVAVGGCGGAVIIEAGRVVLGSESFSINATPGRDLRIVMRTSLKAGPVVYKMNDGPSPQEFTFSSPLGLLLSVDGDEPEPVRLNIVQSEGAAPFIEVMLDIPAARIVSERPRITIGGDHISCAYWFYQ